MLKNLYDSSRATVQGYFCNPLPVTGSKKICQSKTEQIIQALQIFHEISLYAQIKDMSCYWPNEQWKKTMLWLK
jgi:hypothetical protein